MFARDGSRRLLMVLVCFWSTVWWRVLFLLLLSWGLCRFLVGIAFVKPIGLRRVGGG